MHRNSWIDYNRFQSALNISIITQWNDSFICCPWGARASLGRLSSFGCWISTQRRDSHILQVTFPIQPIHATMRSYASCTTTVKEGWTQPNKQLREENRRRLRVFTYAMSSIFSLYIIIPHSSWLTVRVSLMRTNEFLDGWYTAVNLLK